MEEAGHRNCCPPRLRAPIIEFRDTTGGQSRSVRASVLTGSSCCCRRLDASSGVAPAAGAASPGRTSANRRGRSQGRRPSPEAAGAQRGAGRHRRSVAVDAIRRIRRRNLRGGPPQVRLSRRMRNGSTGRSIVLFISIQSVNKPT